MSASSLHLDIALETEAFKLEINEQLELDEVTALFGPSGSGKSSLLRCIAGFETPSRGRIAWGGEVWFDSAKNYNVPAHERAVGLMFQDARLFEHTDVAGNLRFAEQRQRNQDIAYEEVVRALELAPLLSRESATLSGGERQRVALGRTLLSGPSLLLLDEPMAALDRDRKADILPYIETIVRRFSIPTIYVSHDIDEISRLAENVLALHDGRVTSFGPTAAALEQLDLTTIVGRFEAGVLLEGRVIRHDARLHLTVLDLGENSLSLPLISHIEVGDTVRVRVRARDVAIATERPRGLSIRNVLQGTVGAITASEEPGTAEVDVRLAASRVQARLTQAAVEELELKEGMNVFALVKSVSFDRGG